jgi:hypothetical protein
MNQILQGLTVSLQLAESCKLIARKSYRIEVKASKCSKTGNVNLVETELGLQHWVLGVK